MSLNHILTEGSTVFPRGKPFTKRNVLKYIHSIMDGSINSKKFKLPDTKKDFLKYMKNVKKIKKNKFEEVVMDQKKDVVVLFYDSQNIDEDAERIIKEYGKAAKRFRELKIKSVKMTAFDVSRMKTPRNFDISTQDQDTLSRQSVYVVPAQHKNEPYHEIKDLNAQNIMIETQSKADISFSLPEFPHLDETEMFQLESGSYTEDL